MNTDAPWRAREQRRQHARVPGAAADADASTPPPAARRPIARRSFSGAAAAAPTEAPADATASFILEMLDSERKIEEDAGKLVRALEAVERVPDRAAPNVVARQLQVGAGPSPSVRVTSLGPDHSRARNPPS